MESAKYCPVCGKLYDLALSFCPACPTVVDEAPGTLLIRVWDYGEGFVVYPHASSLSLDSLEEA